MIMMRARWKSGSWTGQAYRYLDVPLEVYVDLIDAESKDEFFNNNIKDAFQVAARSGGER
jgi:hypothetical protein